MNHSRKPRRSYATRQGRMSDSQRRALTELWGEYGLELADGNLDPIIHFEAEQPVTIEIGFGMGDSLVESAVEHPSRNFLGIEVHRPGIGHLLREASVRNLANLRVYANDSIEVLRDGIVEHSIDCVQVFFPDPWPKRRHHKRRLVNSKLLDVVANCLASKGVFHIATDWMPYAKEILALLEKDGRFNVTDVPERPITKYERRGLQLGHTVTDIAFRRACVSSSL